MLKKLTLKSFLFYKSLLKLGVFRIWFFTDQACRFYPSCADYTYQAVKRYGVPRGIKLGVWRILRCNPFNRGGFDPIP